MQTHEVLDTQAVDIGIIGDALLGKVVAEISTVGANGNSQLLQGEVVLEVESCCLAMQFQNSQSVIVFPKNRLKNAIISRILTTFASQKEK